MRRLQHFALFLLFCGLGRRSHGFSLRGIMERRILMHQLLSRTLTARFSMRGRSGDSLTSSSPSLACPFSKHFPKYRIDLTRVQPPKKSGLSLPFVVHLQKSLRKREWEAKMSTDIEWMETAAAAAEGERGGVQAITIFQRLWDCASELSFPSESAADGNQQQRVILGLTDATHLSVVQHWKDIFDWMQQEDSLQNLLGDVKIDVTLHNDEKGIVLVELVSHGTVIMSVANPNNTYNPDLLTEGTQSWVKRILVDQGICPFTKSVKLSGQGLGELGIPVAKIYFCSSDANQQQLSKLMADSWREIAFMLDMGPSGKEGISSILLAAPEYDDNFDLWAGPVFAMLEKGVVACGLEPQVGVVCFHPQYATPDGRSFPGFGHMHSVPRLKKWLHETDPALEKELSDDEIAAGGAWQRRTPHATINVLRAEQLEAAEGRRSSSELYTENIRRLVGKTDGIGSTKLQQDLQREQALG